MTYNRLCHDQIHRIQQLIRKKNYSIKILLFFVALGGIPTTGQGVRHVGIFVGKIFDFCSNEIGLEMRSGPHGQVDGLVGLRWGSTPTR